MTALSDVILSDVVMHDSKFPCCKENFYIYSTYFPLLHGNWKISCISHKHSVAQ